VSAPEGLKTQAHSEQPQQCKPGCSTHTNFRLMAALVAAPIVVRSSNLGAAEDALISCRSLHASIRMVCLASYVLPFPLGITRLSGGRIREIGPQRGELEQEIPYIYPGNLGAVEQNCPMLSNCEKRFEGRDVRKHGLYSAEALAERKRVRDLLTQSRELLKQMQKD
jgi:hypothetical protein